MDKNIEPTSQDHSKESGKDVLYSIKKSDYVGRYMVAARDIQPGEAIFSDQPACIGKFQFSRSRNLVKWRGAQIQCLNF